MKNSKKSKSIAVIVLIIAILGISIAFAALSTQLRINGTGTMDPANWDIHFEPTIATPTIIGDATVETAPTVGNYTASSLSSEADSVNTVINPYKIKLTKPGDTVTYEFVIKNDGELPAYLSEFTKPDPKYYVTPTGGTKTEITASTTDAELAKIYSIMNTNLIYKLEWIDGTSTSEIQAVPAGTTDIHSAIAPGGPYEDASLPVSGSKTLKLTVGYESTAVELPSQGVEIGFGETILKYTQVPPNSNAVGTATPVTPEATVAYTVGQEVTVGGESFYVIEESDSSKSTVTLLAKYNLNKEGTAQVANVAFGDTACAFSNDAYWFEAYKSYRGWGTKKLDINTVPGETTGDAIYKAKQYAISKGGENGRLLTYEEAVALITSNAEIIYGWANELGIGSRDYGLTYWLSSAHEPPTWELWFVNGRSKSFGQEWYCLRGRCGVRPVMQVSKSLIS